MKCVSRKHCYLRKSLHGVTIQNKNIVILTAVRTSNLTVYVLFQCILDGKTECKLVDMTLNSFEHYLVLSDVKKMSTWINIWKRPTFFSLSTFPSLEVLPEE
jgi:cytochrome c-type biogenesis protein CcmH/NrfF